MTKVRQMNRKKIGKTSSKHDNTLKKSVTLFGAAVILSTLGSYEQPTVVLADENSDNQENNTLTNDFEMEEVELKQKEELTAQDNGTQEVQDSEGTTQLPEGEQDLVSGETVQEPTPNENSLETERDVELVEEPDGLILPRDAASFAMARGMAPATFIETIGGYARVIAANNDLYASVMIAQAVLESGWGSSSLSSAPNYNLFGIKGSYNGQSVTMQTQEYFNGKWVTIYDKFRKYPSYAESLQDNARLLKNNLLYTGAWKSNTSSYRDATAWLTGKYATDPGYAGKLNAIIQNFNLTRFDTPGSGGGAVETPPQGNQEVQTPPSNPNDNSSVGTTADSYTVVSGDTLYSIARKNGMSVAQLKSLNGLTSDMIRVGQVLQLKQANNTPPNPSTPAPSTPPPSSNGGTNQSGGSYTVVSGDTLYSIARKNGMSVAQLKNLNGLTSDIIRVGQTLKLNGTGSNSTMTPPSSNGGTNQSGGSYTVVSGDTLYSIARKNGMSVSQLKSVNGLTSDMIRVGQTLRLNGTGNNSAVRPPSSNGGVNQSSGSYTVVSGDTLYSIARKNGLSVSQLKSINGLSSDIIRVGAKLKIGQGSSNVGNNSSGPSSSGATYTVSSGDTLYSIARRNQVSVAQLKSWNNLTSDIISIGQKLSIGGKGSNGNISTQQGQGTAVYTVTGGDTLFGIAKKHGMSIGQVKELNGLKNDLIMVGQKLKVAGSSTGGTNRPSANQGTYKVTKSDTLWSVAKKNNMSVSQLKKLNNLSNDLIYVGQLLKLR